MDLGLQQRFDTGQLHIADLVYVVLKSLGPVPAEETNRQNNERDNRKPADQFDADFYIFYAPPPKISLFSKL